MGMILGFALFAGVMTGTVASIALGIIASVMTRKVARIRRKVWPLFAAGVLVCQATLLTAIPYYPFTPTRPGADYDIVMKNFFLRGSFYAASPGVAAMLAWLLTRLARRKSDGTSCHAIHNA